MNTNLNTIYAEIATAFAQNRRLLAVLLDPDKIDFDNIKHLVEKINQAPATHIFIGGSLVFSDVIEKIITEIKRFTTLPLLLFPGHPSQIALNADGILFLSLLSGRNPDYLIEHQKSAAPLLKKSNLEVIPTAYLLIESGAKTAVERVSKTHPILRNNIAEAVATAQAGELMGHKLIYLEAGSGAVQAVSSEMIEAVAKSVDVPVIVGGGIKTKKGIENAYNHGATLVVIGTAFENDSEFFNQILND
ncbi:geranylgeranylglyceryl/heptaprenylglyceryl phosphate synthase [Flavobacterium sp.]|uniref:geranylgeranylglyceryl/heptaprenylglyceryl phosphate synthase n=1 Tax=Flavobacterium sp. TaxID=239 RepID=UPI0026147708|nr:geranylgeranylglyceryl/heptaprenylglyceryl phosphate synthase [Flavobacterium sp.]MDD3003319.1 geranylgeranylglyceryl/heptaprenylglyceryl phosphate synthase [Flavobacterium sp.]